MAGALALVLARAARDDAAGVGEHVTEFALAGEALRVAGIARKGVVQDEELVPIPQPQ